MSVCHFFLRGNLLFLQLANAFLIGRYNSGHVRFDNALEELIHLAVDFDELRTERLCLALRLRGAMIP
ncbi:MAG TPA: hypothetical protein VGN93_17730 [Shinella sp.]|uniref:hypothetical protein n=1 Tax=Shinella sp. TaxID=1870904 RepID=UPI002E11D75D|nr:hypothetical protein [Shinella sp.]